MWQEDHGIPKFGLPSLAPRRARYEDAVRRNWRRGDRFRMFWDAPETPGLGMWWHGCVRGRVQRERWHPLRSSPWEALRVRWDRSGQRAAVK